MSKEDILTYFYTNNANLDVKKILLTLLAGLCIGILISLCYYVSTRASHGVSYNQRFCFSLILTLLISLVIMLMISSNIVISLGMVGALSIVRFRTAIKDSRDTIFLFFAITEGLCVGSRNFKLSIVSTLFIGIVILIASYVPLFSGKYLLVITANQALLPTDDLIAKIRPYVRSCSLTSANAAKDHSEYIFTLRAKKELSADFLRILQQEEGIATVNLVADSSEAAS